MNGFSNSSWVCSVTEVVGVGGVARMIRFLGRSRLWLEVVGQGLGEVAQWDEDDGGRR